jgi:hypothetical protein
VIVQSLLLGSQSFWGRSLNSHRFFFNSILSAMLKRSLGYAYVNFHNQKDAERALHDLNYTEISVRKSPPL